MTASTSAEVDAAKNDMRLRIREWDRRNIGYPSDTYCLLMFLYRGYVVGREEAVYNMIRNDHPLATAAYMAKIRDIQPVSFSDGGGLGGISHCWMVSSFPDKENISTVQWFMAAGLGQPAKRTAETFVGVGMRYSSREEAWIDLAVSFERLSPEQQWWLLSGIGEIDEKEDG